MSWHVEYLKDTKNHVVLYESPEAAIKAACRLIDMGIDVHAIGNGRLNESIDRAQIAKIYDLWHRTQRH
jgi:hypothetical protein